MKKFAKESLEAKNLRDQVKVIDLEEVPKVEKGATKVNT